MEQLMEFYAKKEIEPNEGYRFIKAEYAYIPIMQTHLAITKRDYINLPLLEEIILRLLEENIHEISELEAVLGIERKLLTVTVADLSVKDLIFCTAERCTLTHKGRTALKELSVTQRSKDCLRNVYLDLITGEILLDHEHLILEEKVFDDSRKLAADFDWNDIDVFKRNFDCIQVLFEQMEDSYVDISKARISELISIDKIENAFPRFIKVSFGIYVSENGYDIDIASNDGKMSGLLGKHKQQIIAQIRERKVLKRTFTKYALTKQYQSFELIENEQLKKLSQKYFDIPRGSKEAESIVLDMEKQILTDRKLKEMEFDVLFPFLCKEIESVEILVDQLDDWCYHNDFFTDLLSRLGTKKIRRICYSRVSNLNTCLSNIRKTIKLSNQKIENIHDLPYFAIVNDTWKIIVVPEDIHVIDDNTHIYRWMYYMLHGK